MISPDFIRTAAYVGLGAIGLYVIIGIILFLFQSHFLYFPHRELIGDPSQVGLDFEPVRIITSDNITLHGWFVPAQNRDEVLLYFHGNGGNISHRLHSLQQFHQLGLSTFIIDYRGYGQSEGEPTEEGTYLDAEASWNYLTEQRGIKPENIILLGRSLGGAIATWLATRVTPKALIIESTFTSVPDRGSEIYPYFPVRLLSRFEYNTLKYVQDVHCPILVVHSPEDEIVPFTHGQKLFAVARQPKEFLQISGGHNDGFLISAARYERGLKSFISQF